MVAGFLIISWLNKDISGSVAMGTLLDCNGNLNFHKFLDLSVDLIYSLVIPSHYLHSKTLPPVLNPGGKGQA